jgi:hypothetical protein
MKRLLAVALLAALPAAAQIRIAYIDPVRRDGRDRRYGLHE